MPAEQLATVRLTAKHRVYLDTSALASLVFVEAAKHGQPQPPPLERKRASDLVAFFGRVRSVGASVVTTSLVLEEQAARVRNASRELAARRASGGKQNYSGLKGSDPKLAASLDEQAWKDMLHTVQWSANVLTQSVITVDLPGAGTGATQASFADALRTDHELLMQNFRELDAMDALHIAIGAHLGVTGFISFDRGWRVVPGIYVYYS